jgi:hypothetical protein
LDGPRSPPIIPCRPKKAENDQLSPASSGVLLFGGT